MKITTTTLANKIAEFINVRYGVTTEPQTILDGIPELAGFDKLADQLELCYHDAQMAMAGTCDLSAENFMATRDACFQTYMGAIGTAPSEPQLEDGGSMIGPVEEDLSGEDDIPVDESNGEGGFEAAPDESEQ